MKAITYSRFGPPEVLRVEEVDQPTHGENEVLIRIRAVAATTTDCTARSGSPFASRMAFGLRRPKHSILGTEFSGEIESVGRAVQRFKKGDRIVGASGTSFGAYAEYLCLAEDAAIATKPSGCTFAEAAAIAEGGLTALPFLRDHGKIENGKRVLINGASGAVGSAAVQLAKAFGAEVTAVCGPANVDLVTSLGADTVIDYTGADFHKLGQTFDIVFDAVSKSSYPRSRRLLAKNGVYLRTALSAQIFPQMLWTSAFGDRKARIAFTGLRSASDKVNDLSDLNAFVEAGALRAVIDHSVPMEQITDAHRYVETGHKRGSVVVEMPGPAEAPTFVQ